MPDDVKTPDVSPTGAPVLPPELVRWLTPLVAVAMALTMAPDMGASLPPAVLTGAKLVAAVGVVLGLVSTGVRK